MKKSKVKKWLDEIEEKLNKITTEEIRNMIEESEKKEGSGWGAILEEMILNYEEPKK